MPRSPLSRRTAWRPQCPMSPYPPEFPETTVEVWVGGIRLNLLLLKNNDGQLLILDLFEKICQSVKFHCEISLI